jgi:hypothetical protein
VIGARGEATIHAGDRGEVQILLTNRALADAERALGRSILAVAGGLADGTTGILEIATLLRVGLEAARRDAKAPGPPVAENTAYDVMDAAGFGAVSVAVMEAVAAVLAFGTGEAEDPNPL